MTELVVEFLQRHRILIQIGDILLGIAQQCRGQDLVEQRCQICPPMRSGKESNATDCLDDGLVFWIVLTLDVSLFVASVAVPKAFA